jgi:hypothetical protein
MSYYSTLISSRAQGHKPTISFAARHQTVVDITMKAASTQPADVVAKAQVVLSEPELLRAMFDVGYFPPNTPPTDAR